MSNATRTPAMKNLGRKVQIVLVTCLLQACAGYRGGWDSVAYLGENPPPDLAQSYAQRHDPPKLYPPGIELQVSIDNRLRTRDTQVILFAVPMSIDPRKVYTKNIEPDKTRVFVTVTPESDDFVFQPGSAVLRIGQARFNGVAGYEFGQWDSRGQRVESGGNWDHRPVGNRFRLASTGRRYLLSIVFDTPVPSPQSEIMLDLSKALASGTYPQLPVIRFTPVRWEEGYT